MAESIGRVNYRADTLDMTSLHVVLKMLIYMRSLAFFSCNLIPRQIGGKP